MPRRKRPRRPDKASKPATRPMGGAFGASRLEEGADGTWMVRTVPAAHATKTYRCPGCDHEIRPGISHVVAWSADDRGSVEDRRHWHNGCWQARARRGPTRRWS